MLLELILLLGLFPLSVGWSLTKAQEISFTIPANQTSYTNSINVIAINIQGNDAKVNALGVYGESNSTTPLDLFENTKTGTISATSVIGNNTFENSTISSVSKCIFITQRDVGNFTNEGAIEANATAENAEAYNATVNVTSIGVDIRISNGTVGNFTNSGIISAIVTAGDANGTNSEVSASGMSIFYRRFC